MTSVTIHESPTPGYIAWILGHLRMLMLLAIAGIGITGVLIYTGILGIDRLDEEVRHRAEAKFAAHYPGLSVTIDSARVLQGRGLQLRGIRFTDPASETKSAELLYIDELLAACDTSLQELLTHEPHVTSLTIRGARLKATRRTDGHWNVAALLPLPSTGPSRVPVFIHDAAIEVCDPAINAHKPLLLKNFALQIAPDHSPEALAVLPEAKGNIPLKVTGDVACDHFRKLSIDGWLDPVGGAWAFRGNVEQLVVNPQLEESLPIEIPTKILSLHDLHAKTSLEYEITNQKLANVPGGLPFHFAIAAQFTEGKLDDPRLPSPLTDLKASVFCDDGGVQMKEVTARCGTAKVQLDLTREGWDNAAPLKIVGRVVQLTLDERLAQSLSKKHRAVWDKFAPTGAIHANFNIAFNGREWEHDIQAELADASIAFEKFPYRVTGAGGTVRLQNQELLIDTFAMASGRRIVCQGRMQNPGPDFTGWLDISSEGPIALDERLLLAMDAKVQKIVRSLSPRGDATFHFRLDRADVHVKAEPYLQVNLKDCSLRYDRFPYPLERITGVIQWKEGEWTFEKLSGANDSAYITGQGSLARDRQGHQILQFEFAAADVPLEDDLKHALPEKMQTLWGNLHPSGTLDSLKILFAMNCDTKELSIDVEGQKYPRPNGAPDSRSVSIEPSWFSYRLDHLTGAFRFRNGDIDLRGMKAAHGRTKLAGDARCQLNPDGGWNLTVDRLVADRLAIDHDLLAALPTKASEALAKLNITGPLQITGSGALTSDGRNSQPTNATWDITVDLENGSLDTGTKLQHIHGGARLVGGANDRGVKSLGELSVDSVVCNGIQMTQVLGPISIDNDKILFGAWAEQQMVPNKPKRQITAKVFEGSIAGDAVLAFDDNAGFEIQTAITDANLARASAEAAPNRSGLTGKAEGFLKLAGSRKGRHTWNGGGIVRMREADIYEVPVMVALLKLLSIRPPDKTAFDKADLDFRIQGDHIYVDRLDFRGDAITLKGSGEADWQRHINLQFYTMVGRDEVNVPILRPIIGEASRQLMLIQVGGSLDQPQLTRQAFPGLNETLQQIFPEAKLK